MTLQPGKLILDQSPEVLYDSNESPSLDLRFAENKTLDDYVSGTPLVDHQRSMSGSNLSPGTFVNSSGLVETAKVNLLKYSEQFNNSWWAGYTNVIPNTDASPTGTLTASTYSSSGSQLQSFFIPIASNTVYTYSLYIKKTTGRSYTCGLTLNYDAGTQYGILLNTNDGTTTATIYVVPTVIVDSVGDYWRIALTANSGSTTNVRVVMYPNLNASGSLGAGEQVIWGAQLEEGSTATTYIPTTNVPSAAPRFDHNPTTGESLGLLIEESRTNEFPYSEDFTNSSWTNVNTSVTLNAATAPDNTLTANRLQIGATNGVIYNNTVGSVTSNSTISVWVKAVSPGTNDVFRLVSAGALSADITATSQWVRYNFTSTSQLSSLHGIVRPADNTAADVYVWGAQFEENKTFPTSYIPTSGSTVPRAADVASITGSNFSRWYNQSASTLFINSPNFPNYARLSNGTFVYISDATAFNLGQGNGIKFGTGSPNTNIRLQVAESNVLQADFQSTQCSKIAIALATNDLSFVTDGVSRGTDTSVNIATGLDRLAITSYGSGYAHLSRLTYYPYRLPDATLQEITS